MTGRRMLLVEGGSDVSFFERLLRHQGITDVDVKPPRALGAHMDSVTVIPTLLDKQIERMAKGDLTHLAVIVDADYANDQGDAGANARWHQLRGVLCEHGYRVGERPPGRESWGSSFENSDGLPNIGLWMMPNHQGDGILEDLLLEAATSEPVRQALLTTAKDAIPTGGQRLFGPTQLSKAQLYTWLAWQRRPGLGLSVMLDPNALGKQAGSLLDDSKEPFKGLIAWLNRIFN